MVLKPSKEFLREALTNNSFDIDSTDKALRITLDHSYSYLYRLQRNMVCYEEYFYTTRNVVSQPDYGDLFMDARERICVNLPASLILQQVRERFRTSKYYRELVDYATLKTDHTMFSRLPVILIDNRVLKSFQMEMYDDFFTAHLPFGRYFLHTKKYDAENKEYEFINHSISLQVINNSFYEDVITNAGMLRQNSYDEKSYDRIFTTYLKDLGVTLDTSKSGTYFAAIFCEDEELGTQLQEVSFDLNGDILIHYDDDAIQKISECTGNITIRFYFYRYLQKYTSYHFHENDYEIKKLVQSRVKDEKNTSEIFLIQKDGNVNYQLPIPTENLLIFRAPFVKQNAETTGALEHFPNANVSINYPNIYRITENVSLNDKFSIYYFYMPPYDLSYEYMYQFYYNYLKYKWSDLVLEDTINRVFFGDMDYSNDPAFEELREVTAAVQGISLFKSGAVNHDQLVSFYNYATSDEAVVDGTLETAKKKFVAGEVISTLSEDGDTAVIPTKIEEFASIFDFVINHEIVGYYYDELDYLRNYESKMHPFEYKVSKLKSFIKDDPKALLNYVRAQNKVGYKYEFSAKDIDLPSRYKTASENGEKFAEPMYLFTVQRPDPNDTLSARIFVDGFLCTCFIYDRYEYTDLIYVPVSQVKDDSYFEIEVFPRYLDTKVNRFTVEHPSCEIEFPSTDDVTPTISDIFFFLGEEDTSERLEASKFGLEFISARYNYYVDSEQTIPIYYQCVNGVANKGPYFNENGEAFTYEGMRIPANDISTETLGEMIAVGKLIQDIGYETDSHFEIKRLSKIVTYDKVAAGESTLQTDDNGVLYSKITKIRVTLKDISLYDQPITIAIAKKPAFEGSKLPTVSYPSYTTPIENSQNVEEYTRAFKNGRLLSKNRYDFTVIDGYLGIQVLEKMKKGETIGFDITPYRNRLIFYKAELDSDLVDLRGYINKPFDMRFYEVYLNGRRLNRTNVYPISPWEFKLAGTHSIYNLEIYEKDRDWEYYGTDFDGYFTLSDFIRKTFMEDDLKDRLIHDVTGDIPGNDNCEDRMPWDRDLDLVSVYFEMFYYMKLVPMHFVSGDNIDFDLEEIAKKYPIIHQLYATTNSSGENVLMLNPDIWYTTEEPRTDDDGNPIFNVYLLGNPSLDDLDD